MAGLKSKYVEFGTMSFADFSKSEIGTVAKFLLTCNEKSRSEVSKSLTSACHKQGARCEIKTTDLLVKQDGLAWQESHVLEAKMTSKGFI